MRSASTETPGPPQTKPKMARFPRRTLANSPRWLEGEGVARPNSADRCSRDTISGIDDSRYHRIWYRNNHHAGTGAGPQSSNVGRHNEHSGARPRGLDRVAGQTRHTFQGDGTDRGGQPGGSPHRRIHLELRRSRRTANRRLNTGDAPHSDYYSECPRATVRSHCRADGRIRGRGCHAFLWRRGAAHRAVPAYAQLVTAGDACFHGVFTIDDRQ